jgi:glycosyltransferase involved in cell wall biosynthesis
MHDTIIFLDEYSERLIKKLDSLDIKQEKVLFLTQNVKTLFTLQGMSLNVQFLEELISKEDIENTDRECLDFISSVFCSGEDTPFHYKGIPMGYFISFYLTPYFMRLFRDILHVDKAIRHYRSNRIIISGTGNFCENVRIALDQKSIPFESFFAGNSDRILSAFNRFWSGEKTLWVAKPLRDLLVEPVQNFLVIFESFLWKLRSFIRKEKISSNSLKRHLIFSADHHTYRIYSSLKKDEQWDFLTCGLYYRFRKNYLKEVKPFEANFQPLMFFKALRVFIHFLFTWGALQRDKAFQGEFEFLGINYWNRIRKLIKYNMLISFPRLFLTYLISIEAFKKHPRSVLFVFHDQPPYYKTIIHAAKKCGVKSMIIQHGVLSGISGIDKIDADFYAAWGERAVEYFGGDSDSYSARQIYITGSPRYDEYKLLKDFDKETILNDLKLPRDKKLILIFTEWSQDATIRSSDMQDILMIEAVMNAIVNLGLNEQCHLIIKPHPTGDIRLLEQFCKIKKNVFPYATIIEGHLEELLFIADLCVSAYSTCILEAMFFDKPSIIFNNLLLQELVPYVSKGAALGAANEEEMVVAIKTLLQNQEIVKSIIEKQKAFIEYAAYRLDGKSSERVCKLLEKIISGENIPKHIE